eukprot:TRINITY_DN10930_c0_g1_i5.p2 TRINITY_DN10930_c0_g1~~TRINITY_DN10930_c0_g1_i5.p2  ORF type:complete len:196 (+),score=33.12 TRINITY_DN10930_c0_g1_i5:44-589(+)
MSDYDREAPPPRDDHRDDPPPRERDDAPPPRRDEGGEEHKLYIGNMDFSTRREDIEGEFGRFGDVRDVYIPTDRYSGKPRGFGFVTFVDRRAAEDAIAELHDREFMGRRIQVNFARPRPPKGSYGGGRDRDYDRRDDYRGGRDYDRGGDRGYDRGGDRGYDRGGDRGYDRGYDRGGYDGGR